MPISQNSQVVRSNNDQDGKGGRVAPDFRFGWGGFFKWSGVGLLALLAALAITLYFLDWNQMRGPRPSGLAMRSSPIPSSSSGTPTSRQ